MLEERKPDIARALNDLAPVYIDWEWYYEA
jgi:hypothetical protein